MAMNNKRRSMRAYLAGFFDGEGWIKVSKSGQSNPCLHVAVASTDPLPIGLFLAEFPEGKLYYRKSQKEHWAPQWQFELLGTNAQRFLEEMKPYIVLKHDQVKIALSIQAHYGRNMIMKAKTGQPKNSKNSDKYVSRYQNLAEKLAQCNTKGNNKRVKTVDTWLEIPTREYRSKRSDVEKDVELMQQRFEALETRLSESDEATSALEKDIVHVEKH